MLEISLAFVQGHSKIIDAARVWRPKIYLNIRTDQEKIVVKKRGKKEKLLNIGTFVVVVVVVFVNSIRTMFVLCGWSIDVKDRIRKFKIKRIFVVLLGEKLQMI